MNLLTNAFHEVEKITGIHIDKPTGGRTHFERDPDYDPTTDGKTVQHQTAEARDEQPGT